MPTPNTVAERNGASLYGMYVVAIAICLIGNLAVRITERAGLVGFGGRVTIAVLAAVPLLVAALLFWRLLRRDLDELLQRIVLEGLAFALIVYVPLAALYVNLRTAGVWTPRLDPPDLIMAPTILVAIGIAIARRRYQ